MAVNIDDTKLLLLRDFKKEEYNTNPSIYLNHAPVMQDGLHYLPIDIRKKDNMCYIKLNDRDLWLYYINGKTYFLPLECDKVFYYHIPTVCWIEYLREPTFVIYLPSQKSYRMQDVTSTYKNVANLILQKDNTRSKINDHRDKVDHVTNQKNVIFMIYSDDETTWTTDITQATIFYKYPYQWSHEINMNKYLL